MLHGPEFGVSPKPFTVFVGVRSITPKCPGTSQLPFKPCIPACSGALGLSGGEWSSVWQETESSKCVYLLERLREIGAAPPLLPPVLPNARRGVRWADCGTGEQLEPSPLLKRTNDEPAVKVSGILTY